MARQSAQDVAVEFTLTDDEAVVLVVCQLWMMRRDIAAETKPKRKDIKRPIRREFQKEALEGLRAQGDGQEQSEWGPFAFAGPGWRQRLADGLEGWDGQRRLPKLESDETFMAVVSNVSSRQRALLLLIELYSFRPWGESAKWDKHSREQSLREVADQMPYLKTADYENVDREFRRSLKQLGRKNIKWGRVALVTGAGLGLGLVTGGLAAPAIGTMIGGFMGLSGAAATSAGLAALGGGAVAAGGLGMAGGTALIVGASGAAGAGVAAAGGKLTGFTSGEIVQDTVKLEVLTQLIILDEEGDDAKARLVIQGMESRLREVQQKIVEVAREKEKLSRENKELRKQLTETSEQLNIAQIKLSQAIQHLEARTADMVGV